MKLASKMHSVLRVLGSIVELLVYAIALALQFTLLIVNVVVLATLGGMGCALLFVLYKASGDSLYVPVVLTVVIGVMVRHEVHARRHGWQPVYL